MNYFALFNLPEQFVIDTGVLEQRYQLLHRLSHPDKFTSGTDKDKQKQKNAEVNDAYQVLKSSVSRGEHLLSVRQVEPASDEETISDAVFLTQLMELREILASANSKAELEQLKRDASDISADYIDRISVYLNNNSAQDNKLASIEINKLKFLNKLRNEIKQRQESFASKKR